MARGDDVSETSAQSDGQDRRPGMADEVVFAWGMESPVRTVVWLCGPAGEGRELGIFESAERALVLFSRVWDLRLVYI